MDFNLTEHQRAFTATARQFEVMRLVVSRHMLEN
jgi:hypothetical protein